MTKLNMIIAACAVFAFGNAAAAQDAATMDLPTACKSDTAHQGAPASSPMGHTTDADEAHAALMTGMDEMNAKMMQGMSHPDIDVAFVCGIIPHHQGAISMARAELEFGKDEQTKEMARKVIEAQTQEIAGMVKWLEEHAD